MDAKVNVGDVFQGYPLSFEDILLSEGIYVTNGYPTTRIVVFKEEGKENQLTGNYSAIAVYGSGLIRPFIKKDWNSFKFVRTNEKLSVSIE
jgi:hypothetical protein